MWEAPEADNDVAMTNRKLMEAIEGAFLRSCYIARKLLEQLHRALLIRYSFRMLQRLIDKHTFYRSQQLINTLLQRLQTQLQGDVIVCKRV